MALDISKLEMVRYLPDGRIRARCPACAQGGGDRKGQHLSILPDGPYCCAAHQGDREHSRIIYTLAGVRDERRSLPSSRSRPTQQPRVEPPLPRLDDRQVRLMIEAIENLLRPERGGERLCVLIGAKREWKPETIRNAALDQCMGWLRFDAIAKPDPLCPDEAPCFIYRAGVKVRFRLPDGSKNFRWLKSEGLSHPSVWRFECIGPETETVWITEGEPDALRLMDMGIGENCGNAENVIALPSASYQLRGDELEVLRGLDVVFCPHDDDPSRRATERLAESVATVGVKLKIRPIS